MVFSQKRIQKAFVEVVSFFQKRRLPYLVVGALAVSIWGRSRATADLDFQLHVANLEDLAKQFPAKWNEDKKWRIYNPLVHRVQKRFLVSGIVVDIMLPRDEFDMGLLPRRVRKRIWNKSVLVVDPEDLIVMKMKAGRPRDFDDATGIIELNPNLDRNYVSHWARKLHLREEYSYLFRNK